LQTRPDAARDDGPLLSVRGLKTYYSLRGSFAQRLVGREAGSVKAVDDVTIELRRGEVLGLVGESGSGKTTLGRTILGLVPATEGSVEFEGREITRLSERELRSVRREMQIVFQDPHASLNPAMTIAQLVEHPLQIHGIGSRAERGRGSPRRSPRWASTRPSSSSTSSRPTSRVARSSAW
jgi:peptide/nickel transport system ATP-binding protein